MHGDKDLTKRIIGCAIEVHRALGPGLLESVYEECLAHELFLSGLRARRQVMVAVIYRGLRVESALRIDLLVEDSVIIEVKAVEKILPTHEAQLLTYLRLADKRVDLILNFNVVVLKDGIRRMVN